MTMTIRNFSPALALIALIASANAAAATVPVLSSDSSSWTRSNGGTGTVQSIGGPGVWNSQYVVAIPAGATNISFTINSFAVDDKGVVQINGNTIGDAVIFGANGAAAGAGTFDFGGGGGSQPYNFAGFTPGATSILPNGTTNVTVTGFVNDTGTSNPSATPFDTVTVASSFSFTGSLSYDTADGAGSGINPVPTLSIWALLILVSLMTVVGIVRSRQSG